VLVLIKKILVPVPVKKNFGPCLVPVPLKKRNLVPVPAPVKKKFGPGLVPVQVLVPPGPGPLCPSLIKRRFWFFFMEKYLFLDVEIHYIYVMNDIVHYIDDG
jgi:hypothetical protein